MKCNPLSLPQLFTAPTFIAGVFMVALFSPAFLAANENLLKIPETGVLAKDVTLSQLDEGFSHVR